MTRILAIDAGTGSVRSAVFDTDGTFIGAASRPWEHIAEAGVPGSMAFDTARNWDLVRETVHEALARTGTDAHDIAAVSASSMREGLVLLDSSGREIWACSNVDARSEQEVRELQARQVDGASVLEETYRRSGQTFALAAQPRLLWLQRHRPERYERAATLLMLSEWILYRLSGEVCIEPSNGSTSGLIALASRQADPALASMSGLRDDLLPQVLEPGTRLGVVTEKAAQETGLVAGTVVGVGGGDAQLAALGLGQTEPGQVLLTAGTFWQLNVNSGSPATHEDLAVRVNAAAVPGLWQAEAIAFHPGTAVRWFRDTFAGAERAEAGRTGRNVLDVLTEEAARIPIGSDGIIPILSDVMDYRNWTHAAPSFLNLSIEQGGDRQRAAMFRSLLENAAIVSRENLALVGSFVDVPADQPVVFAGGSASSAVWCSITADVLGRTLRIPVVTEATSLGAAACALAACEDGATAAQIARSWEAWRESFEPDPARHEQYAEVVDRWRRAYWVQRDLVAQEVTTPLWHAPGS